jgi:sugar-specific transcriptional regulator TrmB
MVGTTEVLDTLKSIGLNLYERKIFVALLAKGIATAAQVSEIAGVPRSRSYDILESLADKGFVVVQPSKPIKYVALKPTEALEKTKENMTRKHNEMLERIDKLRGSKVLGELESIYSQGFNLVRPSEMTGTLKGRFTIDRQLRSIIKEAKSDINIVTTESGLSSLHQNHIRVLKKAAKKGVKLRILAPGADRNAVKALSEIAEIRHLKEDVGRFTVVDDDHVFFALTDDSSDESQDVALWANSPHAASNIASPLFCKLWEKSQKIGK